MSEAKKLTSVQFVRKCESYDNCMHGAFEDGLTEFDLVQPKTFEQKEFFTCIQNARKAWNNFKIMEEFAISNPPN
jgi:hypothetical protein